jgi:hypothetical protein
MMWSRSLVVLGALAVVGCGAANRAEPTTTTTTTREQAGPRRADPPAFRYIPADTPYLYASSGPFGPRLTGTADQLWTIAFTAFKEHLSKASSQTPGTQAILALFAEIEADKTHSWKGHLGLPEDLHYVVYGLSVWPVVRIEIADPQRLTAVLQRLWTAARMPQQPVRNGKMTYWSFSDREDTVVLVVTERELVASVITRVQAEQVLPYLIGTKLPATSLAQAPQTPAMARLLHYARGSVGYVDLQRIADIALGRATGVNSALRGDAVAQLTPACVADVDRLVAFAPRILWGVSRLDEHGVASRFVVEIPRALRSALRALRTPFGGMGLAEVAQAAVAMGGAVDVDGLVRWLRDGIAAARAAPFQCAQLAPLNDALATVGKALDATWPEQLHGLRGGIIAIDTLAVAPPRYEGVALVDGANIGKLAAFLSALPGQPFGPVASDGKPVALPLQTMGVPAPATGHLAITETRASIVLGPESELRAEQLLHTPAEAAPPLMFVRYDLPRFRDMMVALHRPMEPIPLQFQTMALGVWPDDDGLRLDLNMSW